MKIKLKVNPKSKLEKITLIDNILHINFSTTPEKGKANKKLIELLADYYKIKKSQVTIIKGEKNKNKIVEI